MIDTKKITLKKEQDLQTTSNSNEVVKDQEFTEADPFQADDLKTETKNRNLIKYKKWWNK